MFQIEPKEQCVVALTKMSSCPACQGIPEIRPCEDYCINVMKGCLAYHAELGDSWDKFVGKNFYSQLSLRCAKKSVYNAFTRRRTAT